MRNRSTRRTVLTRAFAGLAALVFTAASLVAAGGPRVADLTHAQPTAYLGSNVFGFGTAPSSGGAYTTYPEGRVVAIAANHGPGGGYWLATIDGMVYGVGGAPYVGNELAGPHKPIVGIAANPTGPGFWLAAANGGVYALGGAPYLGNVIAGEHKPITSIAAKPDGSGYWLGAANGMVYGVGGAPYLGNVIAESHKWIVGIAATNDGKGVWAAMLDGMVYPLGAAKYLGNVLAGPHLPITGIATNPTGTGFWLSAWNGGAYGIGGAPYLGNAIGPVGFLPAQGIVAAPGGGGYALMSAPPPPPPKRVSSFGDAPANSGSGRRLVYCNSCQRVWWVEDDGYVANSYAVSGRRGVPRPGTYHVFRKINPGSSGSLRLPYFVGFAYGSSTDIGFHGIPLRPDGSPIQSDAELGIPLSHGCVRQNQAQAKALWDWTPIGTPVVVLP